MPSTPAAAPLTRRVLTLVVVACLCSSTAAAAVSGARPSTAKTGCFPTGEAVDPSEAVGDVVEIEMLLCFRGSVTVDGPGYELNATLGDGNRSGSVTLRLNTHLNGSAALGVTSDTLDSVPVNATGNGSFEPGNYTVTIRDGSGDVVDTVEFRLGEPRARNLSVFRASRGAAADLQTVAAVRSARNVSRVDSRRPFDPSSAEYLPLATNETLVVAIRAGGIEGAMAVANGTPLARFRAAVRATGATLQTRQTPDTTTPERQPLLLDLLNSSATHLVSDPATHTYYLVVDTRQLWGEWEGSHGGPVHVGSHWGMGFAVRFSMQGEISEESPPVDLVAADFRIVEAAVDFPRLGDEGGGRPVLAPEKDVRLRARSTLAAESTVTVRVSGLPDGPIERAVRVRNLSGGPGFVLPLNLSDVPNGTDLSIAVDRDGKTLTSDPVRAVVRTPRATLDLREDAVQDAYLSVYSLSVTHPSVAVVYAEDGSHVGTATVDAGTTVGLKIRLADGGGSTRYRVALYRDVDRSGSLTSADEAYRQNGTYVQATVDTGPTPTPVTHTSPTPESDENESTTGRDETAPDQSPTESWAPGFGVVTGLAGLLLAAIAALVAVAREPAE